MSSNATPEQTRIEEHAPGELGELPRDGRVERMQARFDTALQSWDSHLRGCGECLSYGTHLCAEGAFIANDVDVARETLVRLVNKISQRSTMVTQVPNVVGLPDPARGSSA